MRRGRRTFVSGDKRPRALHPHTSYVSFDDLDGVWWVVVCVSAAAARKVILLAFVSMAMMSMRMAWCAMWAAGWGVDDFCAGAAGSGGGGDSPCLRAAVRFV